MSGLVDEAAKAIFTILDGSPEGQGVESASARVAFFCRVAGQWAELGRSEQASWCLSCAMRHSDDLEASVRKGKASAGSIERHVVQLFNLYIQAASMAATASQQASGRQAAAGIAAPSAGAVCWR